MHRPHHPRRRHRVAIRGSFSASRVTFGTGSALGLGMQIVPSPSSLIRTAPTLSAPKAAR